MSRHLTRLAPPYTRRRLVLQVARAVAAERRVRHRVNRRNLAMRSRFRGQTMFCNICGRFGPIYVDMQDLDTLTRHRIGLLRETLRCTTCGATMRTRTVAEALLRALADDLGITATSIEALADVLPTDLQILDTDADSLLSKRLSGSPGWVRSLFVPGKANGAVLDDERMLNVDLEKMPFPDERFDIIITSEVMEHVRFVDEAHREIARCLRPGGHYVFTVPYDDALAETWRLIDPDTDQALVDPPHIHGDPVRAEGIKSYRVFGRDLLSDLDDVGLAAEFRRVERPDLGIHGGDVFVARRRTILPQ